MRKGGSARNTREISHLILIRNVDEQGHELTGCKGGGRGVMGGMCRLDCYQCLGFTSKLLKSHYCTGE